ncbi:alpha/beta hydrolase [Rossellomorea vietnamensis]|uniref:Alpha/beta hydrolase n=1 Tax=Rossellomorea vietnamensis TaxID=218284 RepID=A0A5D4NT66_9BACI|nr:alpha/beta hydrolase [Rossellomorea vietnamensis]TYS16648.1 alpha/beta hydrolase [Rossellomorea vietnamensis]
MEEKFIEINGKSLFVKVKGHGEPIIFLHGGPGGSLEYFLPHIEPLAEYYQIILYDQAGCGQSEKLPGDHYSIEDEIDNLESLRKALNLEKVALFGESWGSILALSYAARYPSNIHKLVLTAVLGLSSEHYHTFKEALIQKLGLYKKLKLGYYSLVSVLGVNTAEKVNTLLDPYYVFSGDALTNKKDIPYNKKALHQISRDIEKNFNLLPVIHKINCLPILIAQGTHDILTPDYIHRNVMKHLKNAQLIEVKESGHWTVLEQPEQIRLLTESFLKTPH